MNIKKLVQEEVIFQYYRKGELWYKTSVSGFMFPVPVSDTGDGTFLTRDKGMLFMRYIRKATNAIVEEQQLIEINRVKKEKAKGCKECNGFGSLYQACMGGELVDCFCQDTVI